MPYNKINLFRMCGVSFSKKTSCIFIYPLQPLMPVFLIINLIHLKMLLHNKLT